MGEELRHARLRRQDDGLGGHQATGGVLVIGHQPPHVLGLLGLHEVQEHGGLGGRQLSHEVGSVIRLHGVEHVRGARDLQGGDEGDGVVVTELLDGVSQPLVLQLGRHLHLTGQGQAGQDVSEVGRLEVLHRGQQRRSALLVH